jgi:hypothetical protein
MYSRFGVPLDVEKGLLNLLKLTGSVQATGVPITAITRDPRLWAAERPESGVTLLDLSPLMPFEAPHTILDEAKLKGQVMQRLIAAGWPPDRVKQEYASAEGAHARADFALTDESGHPIAIVELKAFKSPLGQPLEIMIRQANLFQVRHGLLTNGHDIILYDSQGNDTLVLGEFPGPREIGPNAPQHDYVKNYEKPQVSWRQTMPAQSAGLTTLAARSEE